MNGLEWSAADVSVVRQSYADTPTVDLADIVGRTVGQVYAKAYHLGLAKSAAYLSSAHACRLRRGDNVGASTRFKKGQAPANKGLRRPGWSPGRMAETQFKQGSRGRTFVPLGTERVNADGYRDRKIDTTGKNNLDWKAVHVLLWIEHHGPVPAGHAVVFADRDKKNICIENLELLSRAELCRRNSIHQYPPELRQVMRLAGKLKRTIEAKDEKQN